MEQIQDDMNFPELLDQVSNCFSREREQDERTSGSYTDSYGEDMEVIPYHRYGQSEEARTGQDRTGQEARTGPSLPCRMSEPGGMSPREHYRRGAFLLQVQLA